MVPSPLAGLSVLLVEDEVLLRKRLAGFLEKEGAEVTALARSRRPGRRPGRWFSTSRCST
jgi:hypothetical protein